MSEPAWTAAVTALQSVTPRRWFRFEETSGTVATDEVEGEHGTVHGADLDTPGAVGSAVALSGGSTYVDLGMQGEWGGVTQLTIVWFLRTTLDGEARSDLSDLLAWMDMADAPTSVPMALVEFNGSSADLDVGITNGAVSMSVGDLSKLMGNPAAGMISATAVTPSVDIRDGQWHLYCASWDLTAGAMRLWIDGVEQALDYASADSVAAFAWTRPMWLGQANSGAGADGNATTVGDVDEVILAEGLITPAEVAALTAAWQAVDEWGDEQQFDDLDGTTFDDDTVEPGGWYRYAVRAEGPGGESAWTDWETIHVPTVDVPEIAASLDVTVDLGGDLEVPPAAIPEIAASVVAVTIDLGGSLTVPAASVPEVTAPLDVTVGMRGTLHRPPASIPQLATSLDVHVELGGVLDTPAAGVPQVTAALPVTVDLGGVLDAPPDVPAVASSLSLHVDLGGALARPDASVPEIASTLPVSLDLTGTLTAPTADVSEVTATLPVHVDLGGALVTPAPGVPTVTTTLHVAVDLAGVLHAPTATIPEIITSLDVTVGLGGTLADPHGPRATLHATGKHTRALSATGAHTAALTAIGGRL